jgi:putative colanic acid biosynthesis acetyltransferase WcaF
MKTDLMRSKRSIGWREAVYRIAWHLVWTLACRWTPRQMLAWRACILRLFGAEIGVKALIFGSVRIEFPNRLKIGDYSAIGARTWIYNHSPIEIGRQSVVSQDTVLCTASHDYETPNLEFFSKPIRIGDECWIAAECFVMPGVSIGSGVVLGTRSLVTRDMPEWMVCAGQPCKPLKPRKWKEV